MDPLTRGSLFHEIQAHFFRELEAPRRAAGHGGVDRRARASVLAGRHRRALADSWHDELAPAVERVWADEIAAIRPRPARLARVGWPSDGAEWLPKYFEFGFGEVPGERDPRSMHEPVTLPGGFKLKGAIDLIEEHRQTKVLRLTDHKTGRKPDRIDKVIIGGGAVLQPVLYAMTIEAALDQPVYCGRLFYCTSSGQLPCARDPAERARRGRRDSKCCRSSIARSSAGSWRRRRPKRRAAAVTSGRSADRACFNRVLRKPQDRARRSRWR